MRRKRRVTSDKRFYNISVSVSSSLAEACARAVAAAASAIVASPQKKNVIHMMILIYMYRYYHHRRQQGQQRGGRSWSEAHVFFCLISKIQTERELRKHC